MEKKQITNSSTVSRQGSQGPTRGTGLGASPVPGSLPHPPFSPTSVELPPQKGSSKPSCGPVTTQQDHLLGPKKSLGAPFKSRTSPGKQMVEETKGSKHQESDMTWSRELGIISEDRDCGS